VSYKRVRLLLVGLFLNFVDAVGGSGTHRLVCEGLFCRPHRGSLFGIAKCSFKDSEDPCQEVSSRPGPDLTIRRSGAKFDGKLRTYNASPDFPYLPYPKGWRPQVATLSHTASPHEPFGKESKEGQESDQSPRIHKDLALLTDSSFGREEVGSGAMRYHEAISRIFF
jgi:hypothetical protein